MIYYRKLPDGGWHILDSERKAPDLCEGLCGASCVHAVEGFAPIRRTAASDPPGTCEACKLLADGSKQLALLEVGNATV